MSRLLLCACCLMVVAAAPKTADPATTQRLGGPNRLLTHVSTDKPVYKAGETVLVRGVVLDAATRVPAQQQYAQITIKGPKGEVLTGGGTLVQDGAFGFSWQIPEGTAGGEFSILAAGVAGAAPGERKFDVRVYRPPRLKSQITFARDGFGPGDTVVATLETSRAEGGIPTGARITAVARVDGADVAKAPCSLDPSGHCTVNLKLPQNIERGEGSIAFTIEDGGVVETATKTIPLLVASFDITLFPEGGDLVAGLPSRVYLEGRTLSQKPADIAGIVVDSKGTEVARFKTEHEGRGRFVFTPASGQSYTLKVTEPANVKKTVALPAVVNDGAVITTTSDTIPAGTKAKLAIAWTGDRSVTVSLRQRDVELSTATLTHPAPALSTRGAQNNVVELDAKDAEGVLIATVSDKSGTPLAERLLFRESKKQLSIKVEQDKPRYAPGNSVTLKVKTTIDGKPAPAFIGLTVTDDSVQEMIDRREQAPSLPVMVFLESDVRELADAHVYLDAANPKAKVAVDLLLGTQGWRRFATYNVGEFINREQDEGRRVFAMRDYQNELTAELAEVDDMAPRGGAPGAVPRNLAPVPQMAPPAPPAKAPNRPVAVAAPPVAPMPDVKKAEAPRAEPVVVAKVPPAQAAKQDVANDIIAMDRKIAAGGKRGRIMAGEEMPIQLAFITVREFAHQVRPGRKPNDRLDFAETLFWSAATKTDANGEATVKFGLSDAVTSFKVAADGYTSGGVLGTGSVKLESVKPFYVEAKLPLEVTEGDIVRLPVAFVNGTREPLSSVTMQLQTKADLRFAAPSGLSLKADERARRIIDLTIPAKTRTADLTFNVSAGGYEDVLTRPLSIAPKGFPVQQAGGGLLTTNGKAKFELTLAADTVPGSVVTRVVIYPSPAGNLSSALKALVQEPSGCFEQTSSTTYPMTMALQYFKTHTGADAAVVADATDKLDRGYKRLTGFECKQKGYEWFGEDPGHEALTAFGILEFTDMSKVRAVDGDMLARSRQWLMKQKDGKGGFNRARRALHTWIEDKDTSDAYITWALLESGEPAKGLQGEIARVRSAADASANSYVIAVASNVMQLAGEKDAAQKFLSKLASKQDDKGMVGGGTQSIVGSTGVSLGIETTAFAVVGWLRSGNAEFTPNVERAIKGLSEASKDGSYGATQSTVLALRAVLEYDRVRSQSRKPGQVQLLVDGKPLGAPVKYDGSTHTELAFTDASELMSPGAHTFELVQTGGGQLPWSVSVKSNRVKPESSPETKVGLEVALSKPALNEGDVVEATARVTNLTDAQLPTVVAIVGVPGGLEPRVDQLKELVKAKSIDAYEIRGRDVVLYWRGMTPKEQRRVPVSLVAAVPGKYVGPASRAYLYYGNEHKVWVAGLGADIAAK
ncbi:MAG: alpha-2-macroglobulin family protein [Archangium sp.]